MFEDPVPGFTPPKDDPVWRNGRMECAGWDGMKWAETHHLRLLGVNHFITVAED